MYCMCRYLFSVERNRKIFKKLFPPNLFEMFINIGHYTRNLAAYSALMQSINTLPVSHIPLSPCAIWLFVCLFCLSVCFVCLFVVCLCARRVSMQ